MIPLTANQSAFLAVVRHSEGTAKAADPWAVKFGFAGTITDFSDHPALLGWVGTQWHGMLITAAGAYQINKPTWLDGQKILHLPDFSPASQDAFAIDYLVRRAQALDALNAGDIHTAIARCAGTWASLPGSTSGQPQATLTDLIGVYGDAGGGFA